MEERRLAQGAQTVLSHLQRGGKVYVVDWPKANDKVRSGLKNRRQITYTTTAWRGEFLPVRSDEVSGKDLKSTLGVALLHEPVTDKTLIQSGIVGILRMHPEWTEQRGK
ncbi:hypothetical protein HY572_02545 [Candidatus Micrarchaeota archaeon]|nr:hypothetical protein [Candidatus Micrarchaeota archaeon]